MGKRELLIATHWGATPGAQSHAKIKKKLKMGNVLHFYFNTSMDFATQTLNHALTTGCPRQTKHFHLTKSSSPVAFALLSLFAQ